METTRIVEIAVELAKKYQERAQVAVKEWQIHQDAEARKLFLIPPEGWPGKNQEQRDAARDKAFAEDEAISSIMDAQSAIRQETILLDGEIQALEAERRSLEWAIRARLVAALEQKNIQANHNGYRGDISFEDTADHQVMTEMDDLIQPDDTYELPF
jgi:hypothetical protein